MQYSTLWCEQTLGIVTYRQVTSRNANLKLMRQQTAPWILHKVRCNSDRLQWSELISHKYQPYRYQTKTCPTDEDTTQLDRRRDGIQLWKTAVFNDSVYGCGSRLSGKIIKELVTLTSDRATSAGTEQHSKHHWSQPVRHQSSSVTVSTISNIQQSHQCLTLINVT